MTVITPEIVRLGVNLLLATLRLDVKQEKTYRNDERIDTLFRLEPQNSKYYRNGAVEFSVYGNYLLVGSQPLVKLDGGPFGLAVRCDSPLRLRVNVLASDWKSGDTVVRQHTVIAPAICGRFSQTVLRPLPDGRQSEFFVGCLTNATVDDRRLFTSRCRSARLSDGRPAKSFVRSVTDSSTETTFGRDEALIRLGARLRVREGGRALLGFANIYLAPGHRRQWPGLDDHKAVKFDIVTAPEHGRLAFAQGDGQRLAGFTYAELMDDRVEYRHDGSETSSDSIDFQVKVEVPSLETRSDILKFQQKVFTLSVEVEPVDDAPQLRAGLRGTVLQLAPGGRIRLSEAYLRVWDADTLARDVWIGVRRADGALVMDTTARRLSRFSQAQLIAGEVFIASDGGDGIVEFCVRDCAAAGESSDASALLTLRVTSAPLRLRLVTNTGVALAHRLSITIGPQNLSFAVDFDGEAQLPLRYVVVDQPKFGLVECRPRSSESFGERPADETWRSDSDNFQICAQFEQSDVDEWRVRYRHTSDSRPQSDAIGFQVHCGETLTPVHVLHVNFIAVRFRVFTRTPLVLNATQETNISAENLLASAFPSNPSPEELLYHVVEPPHYGMLTRRIQGGKFRRIGVSSNFTQAHINDAALLYRLHYVQYAPLRDHFTYRLITASATSELMRFEIGYLPGPNSLSLVNRTLILAEGAIQTITNSTLWLETPDERDFRFIVAVAPFNGWLALTGAGRLVAGESFTSADILAHRLSYEHCGDETIVDRWLLSAESTGVSQSLSFHFWLSASIVPVDDNAPRLRRPLGAEDVATIALVAESERVFHPALVPWLDADSADTIEVKRASNPPLSFHVAELFRDFIICTRDSPELSVRNFTSRQLEDRLLIARHLNLRKSSNKLRYTVSDGKHTVASTLRFVASPPFLRLKAGRLEVPANFTAVSHSNAEFNRRFVLLTSAHLAADTNLDVDPDVIRFERFHAGQPTVFRLADSRNGSWRTVDSFTQRDLYERRVFLALDLPTEALTVPMRISAGENNTQSLQSSGVSTILSGFTSLFHSIDSHEHFSSKVPIISHLTVEAAFSVQPVATLSQTSQTLVLTGGPMDADQNPKPVAVFDCLIKSVVVLDRQIFAVTALWPPAAGQKVIDAKFFIARPPRFGVLTLDKEGNGPSTRKRFDSTSTTLSHSVYAFRQSDLDAGRLRYVNLNGSAERDDFIVRVGLPAAALADGGATVVGPWRMDVQLVDFSRPQLIPSSRLSVRLGVDLMLRPADLRLDGAAFDVTSASALEYRIMRAPAGGQLVLRRDGTMPAPIQSAFRHSDLAAGQVVIRPASDAEGLLEWEMRVCTSSIRQAKCSPNAKLRVTVDTGNEYGPTIERNEPLVVPLSLLESSRQQSVVLSAAYLLTVDRDTSPAGLKYLIWQVDGGSLQWRRTTLNSDTVAKAVTSFTQEDVNEERILFVRESERNYNEKDEQMESRAGFQFLVTDGRHQTLPAVFRLLTRDPSQSFLADGDSSTVATTQSQFMTSTPLVASMAANARLDVAPGVRTLITNVTLRVAALDIRPDELVYRIRRPPLHGRLSLDGNSDGGPVTSFTQADIDRERLAYTAPADPGAWYQRDAFEFSITARSYATAGSETVYTYRIHSSFAHVRPEELAMFLTHEDIVNSYDGSVMLNANHLNLSRLAVLCDDVLLLSVERLPPCGRLTRLRNVFGSMAADEEEDAELDLPRDGHENYKNGAINSEKFRAFRADELASGREIIYRHIGPDCDLNHERESEAKTEIILRIFALREKTHAADGLRLTLRVSQLPRDSRETIERFPDRIDMMAGGRVTLDSMKFRVISAADSLHIIYRLDQPPTDGLRLMHVNGTSITSFTQLDVDNEAVALGHNTLSSGDAPIAEIGALAFRIGESEARRVLAVRVEPPAVRLANLSDIGLAQGRTYVVLNRSHLGAARRAGDDPRQLVYNVTRPPANGSLYWVAGDTEARAFTQKNVDDGEILYAQLNMNAYEDCFGFVLSNGEATTSEKEARVFVAASLAPLSAFVTRARTITQITLVHLNVTPIMNLSPKFLVVVPSKFGRLLLRGETNTSATFFTGADVTDGNLFFHAFHVGRRETDQVELELILNDAQPARLFWPIDVRPFGEGAVDGPSVEITPSLDYSSQHPIDNVPPSSAPSDGRPPAVDLDYRFPILILLGMVGFIVALALCQWCNASAAATEAKEKEQRRSSMRTASLSFAGGVAGSDSSEGSGRAIPGLGPPRPLPEVDDMAVPIITSSAKQETAGKPTPRGILTASSSAVSTFTPAAGSSSDFLKSTVYATIGSPNGGVYFEGSQRRPTKLAKSVTLADDAGDRERPINGCLREAETNLIGRNAPVTAAVRSMTAASLRRRTLATVEEDCSTAGSTAGEFDTFGQGFYDVSRGVSARASSTPLVAVNPAAAARRFLLPSRRPVAVAAVVVPPYEVELDEDVMAHVKLATSTFRDGITDDSQMTGSILSPGKRDGPPHTLCRQPTASAVEPDRFDSSFKSNEYWV